MDVEEYFPESISEIHCDESRKDETTLLGSLHCHICYQELGDLNPVKHFKPCKCSRIYVHRNCANQKSEESSACSMCGTTNTLSRIKPKGKNQDEVCIICKKSSKEIVQSHMIQPCFCGVSAHYDCLIPLLDNKSSCNNCGVSYQVFKKAPVSSFLRQHICHFICFIVFLIVLVGLCGLAVSNSYLITKRTDSRSILFTAWSLLLLISMIGIVIMIIRYTINVAFPRYQVEFGSVTVHPSQSRILPKDSITHRKFAGAVVMSDIVRIETGLSVIPEEDEEKSDSGRLDLTLGQHLFGIISVPNGHTSSTPIEDSCGEEKFKF